jgi:hypothetical protein
MALEIQVPACSRHKAFSVRKTCLHVDCSFSNIEIQLILLILYKTVTNWIDNLMTFKLIDVVMVSVLA